eukprot:TRINITY_DN3162_c0_g1_i2.p1 TRINITY_DN3162_c0_g1~~TRINITY_DN3162_c0_g1_i2.p1  ORF type:complete len:251 (-),score=44.49 TRINITY_DN3162_c0_g1_i2:222-974(-)
MGDGATNDVYGYTDLADAYLVDSWFHVALVIEQKEDKSINIYIYADSKTSHNAWDSKGNRQADQSPILIGYFNNQDSYTHYLKGQVDEMRFWGQVRTKDQITTFKNRPYSPSMTALIAYYSMDDPDERYVVDSLGRYSVMVSEKIKKKPSGIKIPLSISVPWNAKFFEISLPGSSLYGKHAFNYIVTSVPSQPEISGKFYSTPVEQAYIAPHGKLDSKLGSNLIFYSAPKVNSFEDSPKVVYFTYKEEHH